MNTTLSLDLRPNPQSGFSPVFRTSMNLRRTVEGFIVDGQVALKSEDTLYDYQKQLESFMRFVGDVPVEQVTTDNEKRL